MADKQDKNSNTVSRRSLLKGLATTPIMGVLTFDFYRKRASAKAKNEAIRAELGLQEKAPTINIQTGKNSSSDVIRVGLIGTGSRSKGGHLRSLCLVMPEWIKQRSKNPNDRNLQSFYNSEDLNIQITGICDVFDLHAEQAMNIITNSVTPWGETERPYTTKRYRTYQEMLESKDIDAVIIATPDFHHAQMTIDAVEAGKHVYCEKSLTRVEDEVYRVYNTVKNSNVVFQLGHQNRQNESFKKAKELVAKGVLGKVTLVETTTNRNTTGGAWVRHLDGNGNPKPGSLETIDWQQWLGSRPQVPFSIDRYYNWTKWFDYATGLTGQLFSHEYDAVNQVLGMGIPKSVVASGGIYFHKDNREIPDIFHIVAEYPDNDLTLLYSASLASSNSRGRRFLGHDATMDLGGTLSIAIDHNSTQYEKKLDDGLLKSDEPLYKFPEMSDNIDAVSSASEKYFTQRGLVYTEKNGKAVDVTHLHFKEWLEAIRGNGETSCNIDIAFEENVTCQMANKSYLEKRRVEWDPVKRRIV
ncbi:MAG: Gfo/Idh/MocA family oxidoreductase [Deferribacteres bacterium]|nr:Gfo/Idh/MocA family oxidoreductase [candidate division KSB1 bacterium]MCB9502042.1 Gfo/Idh/MocA family oxidoreductase [Deferribacteres bacterium]